MKIENIQAHHFKAYKELDLDIPEPGLYLITGQNHQDPKIGGNGAGKSTIMDMLAWALTGKTVRGQSGPSVEPNDLEPNVSVKVKMDSEVLTRTRHPIKLMYAGEVQEEQAVEDEFGWIVKSAIHGQFGKSFLDLTPAQKMEVFDSTLPDFDTWLERSAEAKSRFSGLDSKCTFQSGKLAGITDRISLNKKRAAELEDELKALDEDVDLDSKKKKKKELGKEWDKLEAAYEENNDELTKVQEELETISRKERGAGQALNAVMNEVGRAEEKLRHLEKDKEKMDKRFEEDKTCPYCFQDIDPENATYLDLKKEAEADVKAQKKIVKDKQKEESQAAEKRQDLKKQQTTLKKREGGLSEKDTELQASLGENEAQGRELADQIKTLENQRTVLLEKIQEYHKALQDAEKEEKECKKELGNLSDERERAEYWIQGFKEVRLLLVDRASTMLERMINSTLSEIGLPDWSVEFQSERITKSGTKSKKLTALIKTGINSEPMPFESWSGGETQRLRIAASVAMADLVSMFMGKTCNVEFFDEKASFLSGEGCEDVLNFLDERAHKHGKTIFVIDHHALDYPFAGEYEVVKNADGISRLEVK